MLNIICCAIQKMKSKITGDAFACKNCFGQKNKEINFNDSDLSYHIVKNKELNKNPWQWSVKNTDDVVIVKGVKNHSSKKKVINDIDYFKNNSEESKIVKKDDDEGSKSTNRFTYHENESKKWVWEFKNDENAILATGNDFDSEEKLLETLNTLKTKFKSIKSM